jgi:curved DNA-binding protein CbpA
MVEFPIQQGLFKYNVMDYHAILGTPLDMGAPEIRQRYLKIAYFLHPDTCKLESTADKKRAIKLFSKLVNPAYEVLSRESSRTEQILIISEIARGLAPEKDKITLAHEDCQKLLRATNNLDLVYRQLLHPLITDLYKDLDNIFQRVAYISELNLIYLMMKSEQPISSKPSSPTMVSASLRPRVDATIVTETSPGKEEPKKETPKIPPQEIYYRRAKEKYDQNSYSEAIAELREVLKIDPRDSKSHCLLGLCYLKSKMATMAKVHITMALEINPSDPLNILAKKELDKVLPPDDKKDSKSTKSGFFGGFFGGKKK